MAHTKRLAAKQVEHLGPGFHADGGNLYLMVRKPSEQQSKAGKTSGSRAWVFRYVSHKKTVQIGLGSTSVRGLADARDLAQKMCTALYNGVDPASLLRHKSITRKSFKEYALELIEAKRPGLKSKKHVQQWTNTLRDYAYPVIGQKAPADISIQDMQAVLNPIWIDKTETAVRLRQRVEMVIDYAFVIEGVNDKRNPASWKGNLDKIFAKPSKVMKRVHFAAAPYSEVPTIMAALKALSCTNAYALRFQILTAVRPGEVRGALWAEINEDEKLWIIPAERMKGNVAHIVPLADEALAILQVMKPRKVKNCDRIFPGRFGGLISDTGINKTLHSVRPGITAHGFRSSFRVWGGETNAEADEVLELALAHANPDKTEAAYARTQLLARRTELMRTWANYCKP